jgi:hypothetical protein
MRTIAPSSQSLCILTSAWLAVSAAALAASAEASAADTAAPDIRGTWRVEGSAIVVGDAPHHPAAAPPTAKGTKPWLRPFVGTFRIDGQEGARFWGTTVSPAASEDFIGTFTGGEGRRFVVVDPDGFFEGSLGEDGVIHYCYRHTTPTSSVASCGTAIRE